MSNFTTFFPSAGGGGGEGSGINSYAPFKVGTTDNNPQGYIHSTGVYTNPVDSSVWLKTGNSVLAPASDYPNAFLSSPTQIQVEYQLNTDYPTGIGAYLSRNSKAWTQEVGARAPLDDLYVLGQGQSPYNGSNVFRYEYNANSADPSKLWHYNGFNINTMTQTTADAIGLAVTSTHIFVGSNYHLTQYVYKYTKAGVYTNVSLDIPSNVPNWVVNTGKIAGIEADATHVYVVWDGNYGGTNSELAYILKYTHAGAFVSVATITKDFPIVLLEDISFFNSTDIMLTYGNAAKNIQIINATTGITQPATTQVSILLTANAGFTIFSSDGALDERICGATSGQGLAFYTFDFTNASFGDTTARTDSSGSAQPLFIKLK